jgi:hypothetical protein
MMATLVLTAVGTAVGGPIGGAVGAILGQQIDHRLFAPKARQGPRLGELAVQTSSYGSQIPKLFGMLRVAGTVIWATDLREERSSSGGGKGRPSNVNYSYSANFAVALSGRRIREVRRIWADGKLLRGAAGDFKTATTFRLHVGAEDQSVDPLIASIEGSGEAVAYRGLAYAVFENFQLAEYANRIPSLTFEVEADEGPVTAGWIAHELSSGEVGEGETVSLSGYAAMGESLRGAVESLSDLVPLRLVDDGQGLVLTRAGAGDAVTVEASEAGAATAGASGRSEWQRLSGDAVPSEASLVYHDPERDFQTGLQRAVRPGGGGRADRRAVAAALAAEQAKTLSEHRLEALWAARRTAKLHLGWRRADLRPGRKLRIAEVAGSWSVERVTLDRMIVSLDLVGLPEREPRSAGESSPGRAVASPDLVVGQTKLLLLDLPLFGEDKPATPRLFAAAAGASAGWRRAELLASWDEGASWAPVAGTAGLSTIGAALGALAGAGSELLDTHNSVEVELLSTAMWLESRSDSALCAGANLAVLGDELFQFGAAEPVGERRFRLSRLLRGRRGTEWAAHGHQTGEAFALVEAENLTMLAPPLSSLGRVVQIQALGLDDAEEVIVGRTLTGEVLRPPSPVHLRARRLANGNVEIHWMRRSRIGWVWMSGADAPLGEESETYRLSIASAGASREVTIHEPTYLYTDAEQMLDAAAGPLALSVVQIGTLLPSRPKAIIFE